MWSIGPGLIKSTGSGKSLCKFLVVIRQMVKTMLGLAGRVLFKANCQGGPMNADRIRNAKFKKHNTDMMETRVARVEQTLVRVGAIQTVFNPFPR